MVNIQISFISFCLKRRRPRHGIMLSSMTTSFPGFTAALKLLTIFFIMFENFDNRSSYRSFKIEYIYYAKIRTILSHSVLWTAVAITTITTSSVRSIIRNIEKRRPMRLTSKFSAVVNVLMYLFLCGTIYTIENSLLCMFSTDSSEQLSKC